MNEKGHYAEIEVGPHGNQLVLLFSEYRKCFNKGEDIELDVSISAFTLIKCLSFAHIQIENRFEMDRWKKAQSRLPLALLPGGAFAHLLYVKRLLTFIAVTRFNAYALHGSGADRHYEALGTVTDGSLTAPDFHRKEYFTRFDVRARRSRRLQQGAIQRSQMGQHASVFSVF